MSDATAKMKQKALAVKALYVALNTKNGRPAWMADDYMAGFIGDVGDLSKLIMAKKGIRSIDDVDQKIKHELSDCLWSLYVIADELGIDLEAEFVTNMDDLAVRIEKKGY